MMLYMTSVLSYNTGSIKNSGEIDNLNFKIKKLYESKNTIKKVKRQFAELGKKHLQIIYLVSVQYPEFMKNSYKSSTTINNLVLKWEQDLNRHFSKDNIQMVNKHVKDVKQYSGKYNSKAQRNTTSNSLRWLKPKIKKCNITSIGKNV